MHDVLFAHQDQLEFEDQAGCAADLDLDVEDVLRTLDDERTAARVRADVASAEVSGARSERVRLALDVLRRPRRTPSLPLDAGRCALRARTSTEATRLGSSCVHTTLNR